MLSGGRLMKKTRKTRITRKTKKTIKKSGGSAMHVTYGDQKFICSPEPGVENSESPPPNLENLKQLLQSNIETQAPQTIDETPSEDITSDVSSEQNGGAKKRKRSIKKKKIEKKKPVKSKKVAKKVTKTRKGLYKDYLDKKYNKEQLMKICKRIGVKITVRKNGNIKPIKKETLIKKITALKFNK